MNLLQPTFLFAMTAIAVPIILHLVFRRHTRIVRLGTIRFLDELMRETVRRRKVRQWLLLALRVASLLLLALLFARPFVRAAQESSGERLVVMLIDKSASMSRRQEGERLVDTATDRANRVLATLDENTTVQAAYFDAAVHPVTLASDGVPRLSAPERLFGGTSYAAALAWARDWCWKEPTAQREVYLYTDLQRSGLDWIAAEPMPEGVRVRIEDVSETDANNLAIVSVLPSPTIVRPGRDAIVRATLFNYGKFEFTDVSVQLTLNSEGRQLHFEETLTVPSQQAAEIEFEISRLQAGLWEGTLDVDAQDDLAFDNRRHLVISSRPQSRVVIVDGSTGEPAPGSGVFFLTRAVGLAPPGEQWEESPFQAEVVRYQEGEPLPSLGDVEIVILADCPPVPADAARLQQFVEAGGGLIAFTGEETTAAATQPLADAGLTPGTILGTRRTSDLPFRVQSWDDEQAVLAPFRDPQQGDLRMFTFSAYTHVEPFPESMVLARFGDENSPALLMHHVGEGLVLWMNSTAGREWNDACRNRLYVPLVHQLLGECVGLTGAGPVQSWTTDAWQARTEGESSGEMLRPGIVTEDRRSNVISVDESESDPESCDVEELAETAAVDPEGVGGTAVESAEFGPRGGLTSRADEWWPYLVLALTGLLFVEMLVANRTTA